MEILVGLLKKWCPHLHWSLYDIFDSSNFSSLHVNSCFFKIDTKGFVLTHNSRLQPTPSQKGSHSTFSQEQREMNTHKHGSHLTWECSIKFLLSYTVPGSLPREWCCLLWDGLSHLSYPKKYIHDGQI